jgi:hypothetical protein
MDRSTAAAKATQVRIVVYIARVTVHIIPTPNLVSPTDTKSGYLRRRSVYLRGVAAVAVAVGLLGSSSCGGTGVAKNRACAGPTATGLGRVTKTPTSPIALVSLPDSAVVLERISQLSLVRTSPEVVVGEYHDAFSLSPDRSEVALGLSAPGQNGRVGVIIVDLSSMKVVRRIETGIAAEALAWPRPRRLVVGLQRGGVALVDPLSGAILHRWKDIPEPEVSAETRNGLVMVVPDTAHPKPAGTVAARAVVVDEQGRRLRSIALPALHIGTTYTGDAGLVVDATGERAYVFAAGAPVAELELRTMHVSYHAVASLLSSTDQLTGSTAQTGGRVFARQRTAVWLGDGKVLIVGRDLVAVGGGAFARIPAGATTVDTSTWASCTLDPRAAGVSLASGRILAFAPGPQFGPASTTNRTDPGIGLWSYSVGGGHLFHLLGKEPVSNVMVAGDIAYVRTPTAIYVIDVTSGRILRDLNRPPGLIGIVDIPPRQR